MPKHFRRNQKKLQPPPKAVYLEHPVGSKEWARKKNIEFDRKRYAKENSVAEKKLHK